MIEQSPSSIKNTSAGNYSDRKENKSIESGKKELLKKMGLAFDSVFGNPTHNKLHGGSNGSASGGMGGGLGE